MQEGAVIGCIDVEKDGMGRVIEIGIVITSFRGGAWVDEAAELKVVMELGTSRG